MEDNLIEAIRKKPCLFDKRSIMYRNKLAKERAWKSIAHGLGVSVKDCMRRWRSLRDRYVRESTKPTGTNSKGGHTWRYLEQLSFIEEHIRPKQRLISNLDQSAEEYENDPTEIIISELDTTNNAVQYSINKRVQKVEPSIEEFILPQEKCRDTPPRPETPPRKRQKMQENAHERFEKLCAAVTDLIESKKESYSKSRNEDFLKVLDSYLLKLPEEEQDNLKIQILNMVHNPLE